METRAAYGGSADPTVYHVTNLADSGRGSLRDALESSEPRVVIFDVSGTISLSTDIWINYPYVTVAGQTAPSPGITLQNYGLYITTNDVLLQHLRIRPGGDTCNSGILVWGGQPYNIVLDHMSVSWGQDENIAFASGGSLNATLWRSITAEGLQGAEDGSSCGGSPDNTFQSHGLLITEDTRNVAVLQSLFAHNIERNPLVSGGTSTYIANNLIFDFVDGAYYLGPGTIQASLVGNYFRSGSSTPRTSYASGVRYLSRGAQFYRADNALDGSGINQFVVIGGDGVDPTVGSPPVSVPGYSPMSSGQTFDFVLANAGARPVDRDDVDWRIIQDAKNRTGSAISSQRDVGGWPSLNFNRRELTPPWNMHTVGASGYRVLEEWLQSYASEVENGSFVPPSSPTPPPATPNSPSTTSADGTVSPPAASVTDNSLAVWTLGSNLEILRNGVQAQGGYGSQILWRQGNIYVLGDDNAWWRWNGSTWISFGVRAPG